MYKLNIRECFAVLSARAKGASVSSRKLLVAMHKPLVDGCDKRREYN